MHHSVYTLVSSPKSDIERGVTGGYLCAVTRNRIRSVLANADRGGCTSTQIASSRQPSRTCDDCYTRRCAASHRENTYKL